MIASIFYLSILTLEKKSDLTSPIVNPEIAIKIPFIFLIANGTGLGLSIVKKIVETLDGEISVRSKPGKWTKFKIVFPQNIVPLNQSD